MVRWLLPISYQHPFPIRLVAPYNSHQPFSPMATFINAYAQSLAMGARIERVEITKRGLLIKKSLSPLFVFFVWFVVNKSFPNNHTLRFLLVTKHGYSCTGECNPPSLVGNPIWFPKFSTDCTHQIHLYVHSLFSNMLIRPQPAPLMVGWLSCFSYQHPFPFA